MKINLPTAVTVALSAAAGVVVAFVASNIIVLEPEWVHYVTVGGTILALFGISPVTGVAFRALLHLSQTASAAVAASLGALQVVITQVHMSLGLHGVLAGVIVFAAGLGFAPNPVARA